MTCPPHCLGCFAPCERVYRGLCWPGTLIRPYYRQGGEQQSPWPALHLIAGLGGRPRDRRRGLALQAQPDAKAQGSADARRRRRRERSTEARSPCSLSEATHPRDSRSRIPIHWYTSHMPGFPSSRRRSPFPGCSSSTAIAPSASPGVCIRGRLRMLRRWERCGTLVDTRHQGSRAQWPIGSYTPG